MQNVVPLDEAWFALFLRAKLFRARAPKIPTQMHFKLWTSDIYIVLSRITVFFILATLVDTAIFLAISVSLRRLSSLCCSARRSCWRVFSFEIATSNSRHLAALFLETWWHLKKNNQCHFLCRSVVFCTKRSNIIIWLKHWIATKKKRHLFLCNRWTSFSCFVS